MSRDNAWFSRDWVQRGVEVLKAMLDQSEERKAEMIQFLFDVGLWDETKLTWLAATSRFNACLSPSKPEYFKTAELWALMKRFDVHDLFLAMADDLGYRVTRIPTDERRLQLLERIARNQELYFKLLTEAGASNEAARAALAEAEKSGFRPRQHLGPGDRPLFDLGEPTDITTARDGAAKGF